MKGYQDMEWVYIILNIILFLFTILVIKKFLPSYFEEKAKNLATKQDIEIITRKTEEVQKEFKEGFELFSSDVRFKYDFYFRQYSELYSKLYSFIMQSEYVRHFIKINENIIMSFDEAPFVELSKTHIVTQSNLMNDDGTIEIKQEKQQIDNPMSKFNKKMLCEYIIDNSEYATQKLIKIAVAYRFSNYFYEGNPDTKNSSCQETANDEELRLIHEMVCCIVSEYNFLRKKLKMDYNEDELKTGIPQL